MGILQLTQYRLGVNIGGARRDFVGRGTSYNITWRKTPPQEGTSIVLSQWLGLLRKNTSAEVLSWSEVPWKDVS